MSEGTAPNLPAVQTEEDGRIVKVGSDLDLSSGSGQVWLSWKPTTNAERALILNALTGNTLKLSSQLNVTVLVKNVIRQRIQLVNEQSGEVEDAVRTVVLTTNGMAFSAVSDGISSSLKAISALWSAPPWTEGIPVIPRQLELGGGRRYFYLEYDTGFQIAPKSAKK